MGRHILSPRAWCAAMAAGAGGSFLLLWAWIACAPLAYLDPEYPFWLVKQRMLLRCDLGQVAILGDSRAAVGILPALLPVRATNLAVGGGKPVEALAAARAMLACPHPPAHVVISIDPGHFMKPDLFWERSVRFGLMGRSDLAELAALSAATGDWSVHEARRTDPFPPGLRATLYAIRFPPYYFNSVVKAGGFLRWWSNQAALEQGLASRGQYYFGTDPGSSGIALDATLETFAPAPVLGAAFDRLLVLLADRGITAWFVPMPVNEATWRATNPAVAAGFAAWLDARAGAHPNLRVMAPAAPYWPDSWFGDGFAHLNPAGAERFSRTLAAELPRWIVPLSAARGPAQDAE